jgi:UDP-N-acetylglucosamine 2-epimerase (non-hydrolysing)
MNHLSRTETLLPAPPIADTVLSPRAVEQATSKKKVLTLFGTRPEVIKLAPVIHQLERRSDLFRTINVASGQHTDLLYPFLELFRIRVDRDLQVMRPAQTPSAVCARVLTELEPIVDQEKPDLILVQGDTTTALAGAIVGFYRGIPVGHVEAGLRSGDVLNPYPEEMNRMLITRLATYHFAATARNRDLLLSEGVPNRKIFLTGNPVVDSLQGILRRSRKRSRVACLLRETAGQKLVVLTTHRRESFGDTVTENLRALCRFVEDHKDVILLFAVHPNPNVKGPAKEICGSNPRVILTEPMNYEEFIAVLSKSWLIVSDSGGIQEEASSLGKPLLILRSNTERPEAIEAGVARLAGGCPGMLTAMLEEAYQGGSWIESVGKVENPFGAGDSGERIVRNIATVLGIETGYSAAIAK